MPPRKQPAGAWGNRPPQAQAPRAPAPAAPAAQAPASTFRPPPGHIQTVGAKRPGHGTKGRRFLINVNSFTIDFPDGFIFHYDVVISSDKPLPLGLNMDIISALQQAEPKIFENNPASFDGRKNMYTAAELQLDGDGREFDVYLPNTAVISQPKVYKVRIALVAKINNEILHRFVKGKQSEDSTVSTGLQALNIVSRMDPSSKYRSKGRFFYTLDNSLDLRNGLIAVRGYFQSIRPGQGQMLLNIDISTGVMYKAGPLINLCLLFLRERSPQSLTSALNERQRLQLSRFLVGVRVKTKDAGNPNNERTRVIRRLHNQGANEVTFLMREGGLRKTVAQYFEETAHRRLQFPSVLCVEIGQGALIPLELCEVVPGQLIRKEIPDDKKKDLVRFASVAPQQRLQDIQKGLEVLAHGQSKYVIKFGVTVNPRIMQLEARLLDAPRLIYGQGSKQPVVQPSNGMWNMADKKFYEPVTIANWSLIILDPGLPANKKNEIAAGFISGCRTTGITFIREQPATIQQFSAQGTQGFNDRLTAAGREAYQVTKNAPTLFLVVLPDGGNDIYTAVKHWGDIVKGVATQCVKSRNCVGANMQFWANVALKVNGKLGGINVILDPNQNALLADSRFSTVVLGADVMHPGAGTTGRPSYAAVVGSKDLHAAGYVAIHGVQQSRQELITELRSMTKYVLEKHINYRKNTEKASEADAKPKRLMFFRDGVSEGQFQQVLDFELPSIKDACRDLGISPAITLVVVGKRHHNRFFPQNNKDADKSGNCRAGTVLDRGIGHPTMFDFYLQSHGGLLGTSRPAHYSVLYDDNNLNADAMQSFCYALCHVYAGSTRSVSIPPPVYYADKVCARAKIHFDPSRQDTNFSETASTATGTTAATETLDAFKRDFMPVHNLQSERAYFS